MEPEEGEKQGNAIPITIGKASDVSAKSTVSK
jgi:hypothetical protein